MNIVIEPGRYVVAVSGGVDSVSLLHVLHRQPDLELIVAHFDHGIRTDSGEDASLVADLAEDLTLTFVSDRADLGPQASEATARQARYDFLRRVQQEQSARAIITAHHQDDVLETAIFNLQRGTGRLGLTSLQSSDALLRPLLHLPKQDLIDYALKQGLSWREDTTNHDQRYARNKIRHQLLVKAEPGARQQLLALIERQRLLNAEIDTELTDLLAAHLSAQSLDRDWFTSLPHAVAKEVLAHWLRHSGLRDFSSQTLERLTIGATLLASGKRLDVLHNYYLLISRERLALHVSER